MPADTHIYQHIFIYAGNIYVPGEVSTPLRKTFSMAWKIRKTGGIPKGREPKCYNAKTSLLRMGGRALCRTPLLDADDDFILGGLLPVRIEVVPAHFGDQRIQQLAHLFDAGGRP